MDYGNYWKNADAEDRTEALPQRKETKLIMLTKVLDVLTTLFHHTE